MCCVCVCSCMCVGVSRLRSSLHGLGGEREASGSRDLHADSLSSHADLRFIVHLEGAGLVQQASP